MQVPKETIEWCRYRKRLAIGAGESKHPASELEVSFLPEHCSQTDTGPMRTLEPLKELGEGVDLLSSTHY